MADKPSDKPDSSTHITTAADEQFWRRVRQSWHRLGDVRSESPRAAPLAANAREVQELADAVEQLRAREEQLERQNHQLNEAMGQLRAERQQFRDLFEHAPDAYIVTNRNGIINAANHAAARLLVLPSERLAGESIERYLPGAAQLIEASNAPANVHAQNDWTTTARAHDGSTVAVGVRFTCAATPASDVRWLIRTAS